MEPQLYRLYGTGTSLYNIKWNLSYTDPMGLALVCIIYSGTSVIQTLWDWYQSVKYTVKPQLYRLYGTGISLYNIPWNLSYTDPMGLALVCIIYSGTSVIQTLWDWYQSVKYTVKPQLYRPGTSLYNIQWNLSYTDPMGLALVCISETNAWYK